MLNCLPVLYEDELFYSWLCRSYIYNGYRGAYHFKKHVLVEYNVRKNMIPAFQEQIKQRILTLGSFETIYENHTMLPQYMRFVEQEEYDQIYPKIKTGDYHPAFKEGNSKNEAIRYCPICAREERRASGEALWHVSHQIRNIPICLKHHCYLKESEVLFQHFKVRDPLHHVIMPAETTIPCQEECTLMDNRQALDYYHYIYEFFKYPLKPVRQDAVITVIYKQIMDSQYAYHGIKRTTKLSNTIQSFYDDIDIKACVTNYRLTALFSRRRLSFQIITELGYFFKIPVRVLLEPSVTEEEIQEELVSHHRSLPELKDAYDKQIDEQYSLLAKQEADKLYYGIDHPEGMPQRVTFRNVALKIGITRDFLARLPVCHEIVETYAETFEEYNARKIVWAYEKVKDKEVIQKQDIYQTANLRYQQCEKALPQLGRYADSDTVDAIMAVMGEKKSYVHTDHKRN